MEIKNKGDIITLRIDRRLKLRLERSSRLSQMGMSRYIRKLILEDINYGPKSNKPIEIIYELQKELLDIGIRFADENTAIENSYALTISKEFMDIEMDIETEIRDGEVRGNSDERDI